MYYISSFGSTLSAMIGRICLLPLPEFAQRVSYPPVRWIIYPFSLDQLQGLRGHSVLFYGHISALCFREHCPKVRQLVSRRADVTIHQEVFQFFSKILLSLSFGYSLVIPGHPTPSKFYLFNTFSPLTKNHWRSFTVSFLSFFPKVIKNCSSQDYCSLLLSVARSHLSD